MHTPEQEKGDKFEIWLALLLIYHGYKDVKWDFRVHKGRPYRQLDIAYNFDSNGKPSVIVEAKYTADGEIKYKLRTPKKKKEGDRIIRIDNLVDEVLERQGFVGAKKSCLVTNRFFDGELRRESKKAGIYVVEHPTLTRMYRSLGGRSAIEDSINAIDISKYSNRC